MMADTVFDLETNLGTFYGSKIIPRNVSKLINYIFNQLHF